MKLRILVPIVVFIAMFSSCDKSPTGPTDADLTDLVGTWEGEANSISLDLTVDSEGKVLGSGVSSTWSISSTGKVTGGGYFGFITDGHYIVANASWSLQLDSDKTNLSGELDVAYSGLHDMDVNLTKSASSFLIVYIASPYDGSTVSDTVDLTATVRSSNAITKVEFYIDDSLKSTDTSSPYSYSWNTTQYSNGSYTIEVIAYDTGDQTASDQHTVIVSNAKWEFVTDSNIKSSPAIGSDGTIYVGTVYPAKKLYAINPDGTKKWEFLTAGGVESSPAIGSDGTIYVGAGYQELYAINPDGTEKWAFLTGDYVNSSPAIGSDGTIYVGSSSYYGDTGNLYAINPDGTKKWEFSAGGSVYSSPAIGSDGTIYVGSWDDNLYAINPDGTKKWEFLTGHFVDSSPAIGSDGTIYVGSNDKKLYAINPDGTKKWEFLAGGFVKSSPAIGSDGTIYVGSDDDKLYAINPDGTKKWEFLTGGYFVRSSPAIGSDGTIYVGSSYPDEKLYAINPDGTTKWKFLAGGGVDSSPAIGSDGTIYVGSSDDRLYALSGSGSLADTPWPMFHHDLKHTGRK